MFNIPRALIIGLFIVITVYLLTNFAYFYALPIEDIATANSENPVATRAVSVFLGPTGATFVAVAIMISILGSLNGSILTGARVPFAMARDGLFPETIAKVTEKSHAPARDFRNGSRTH